MKIILIFLYMTRRLGDSSRWIGGIQLFLIFTMGPLAGRFFDRGYLYVRFDQSGEEII